MFTQDQIDRMNPKQKALFALLTAAETFLTVTNDALEAKHPGRGQQNRDMVDRGEAHLCISIQCGSGEIHTALALVKPEFGKTLDHAELELHGSIAACFADPDALAINDLAKLN